MATFATYNYDDRIRGGQTESVAFTLNDADNNPIVITGATIYMNVRKNSATGKLAYCFSVGNGITITDVNKFNVAGFILDVQAGVYYYDIKIIFANGEPQTYVKGKINVIQNATTQTC